MLVIFSTGDKENREHAVFDVYTDPCRMFPGKDHDWTVGKDANIMALSVMKDRHFVKQLSLIWSVPKTSGTMLNNIFFNCHRNWHQIIFCAINIVPNRW